MAPFLLQFSPYICICSCSYDFMTPLSEVVWFYDPPPYFNDPRMVIINDSPLTCLLKRLMNETNLTHPLCSNKLSDRFLFNTKFWFFFLANLCRVSSCNLYGMYWSWALEEGGKGNEALDFFIQIPNWAVCDINLLNFWKISTVPEDVKIYNGCRWIRIQMMSSRALSIIHSCHMFAVYISTCMN